MGNSKKVKIMEKILIKINKNTNNKGKPFINKEHPLYEQYKQFMYLDDS